MRSRIREGIEGREEGGGLCWLRWDGVREGRV